jgi:hypothetical protein
MTALEILAEAEAKQVASPLSAARLWPNQEVTGGLVLQEIDVGFRFKFSVPASVSTVPVAWIVRPAVQFLGL